MHRLDSNIPPPHHSPHVCAAVPVQAAWGSQDKELSAAMHQLDGDIGDTLELFGYAAGAAPGQGKGGAHSIKGLQYEHVGTARGGGGVSRGQSP
jgi:hypothetical protein